MELLWIDSDRNPVEYSVEWQLAVAGLTANRHGEIIDRDHPDWEHYRDEDEHHSRIERAQGAADEPTPVAPKPPVPRGALNQKEAAAWFGRSDEWFVKYAKPHLRTLQDVGRGAMYLVRDLEDFAEQRAAYAIRGR